MNWCGEKKKGRAGRRAWKSGALLNLLSVIMDEMSIPNSEGRS